jgi:nucleoside 2-deoxyribosyltransferase
MYYINSLIERGLLRNLEKSDLPYHRDEMGGVIYERPKAFSVAITADGWDYLERHDRNIEDRTQAFVAMSFSEDLKPIWEGPIYNAIKKAGYKPYRADAEPHSERIDAKIISEIKYSRFVVADVTEQKHGVYFEAGYALGMGLPVLWCVHKDDLEKVHFDTRQYNHIVWQAPDELENKLFDFICAIIGKGKKLNSA